MDNVLSCLGGAFIQWASCIAVGLPLFLMAVRSTRHQGKAVDLGIAVQLALFFLVSLALTRLEPMWPFTKKLWQSMTLEALWALIFIFVTRSSSKAGLTLRISSQAWRASLAATGLLLLFVLFRGLAIKLTGFGPSENAPLVLEFLLYQLTMPGLAEELSYRGAIQPGLNKIFGRPWRLLGAKVGWGWVITSLIFWAPHAFRVDAQMHLFFYWPTLTMQLIAAFVFGWIRERSGSVFPPMLAHNLVNLVWTLL